MRFLLLFSVVLSSLSLAQGFPFTVLHTNDLHSHVEGTGPDGYVGVEGKDSVVSGQYARLATLIKTIREEKAKAGEAVLLADAGDFFSGTLFHALAPSEKSNAVPELEYFQYNKYDAVSLGNHEFDAGPLGFTRLLNKGFQLGATSFLISTNLAPQKPSAELTAALTHLNASIVKTISHGDQKLRVGFLGFVGPDAARSSAGTRLTKSGGISFVGYDDKKSKEELGKLTALAKARAKTLREKEGVQIVIAIIHGASPEDTSLAQTEGIDLVIAGHSHELYRTPKIAGGKVVAQAGSYGRYLGKLELEYLEGKLTLRNPNSSHVAITSAIKADPQYVAKVTGYKKELTGIISHMGYEYDSPVATISKTIPKGQGVNDELGVMVTSAIRDELNRHLKDPVDLYFTSASLIRESLEAFGGNPTPYQFSDVFRILPLGFDGQLRPGSPIQSFYLSKKDVWRMINFLEVYRHVSANFTPAYSNSFSYRVRGWGVPFVNRLADVKLHGKAYREWPEYVHVASNTYVAGFFDKLPAMSKGLVKLVARDKQGNPVAAFTSPTVPPEPSLFGDALKRAK